MKYWCLLFLLFLGCCPCRKAGQSTQIVDRDQQRDSVYVSARDTVRIVVWDSMTRRPLPTERERNRTRTSHSHLVNSYCESEARVDTAGVLSHTLCTRDSALLPMRVVYRDRTHTDTVYLDRWRDRDRTQTVDRVVERQYVSWWQRVQIAGFWVLLAALAWRNRRRLIGAFGRFCGQ